MKPILIRTSSLNGFVKPGQLKKGGYLLTLLFLTGLLTLGMIHHNSSKKTAEPFFTVQTSGYEDGHFQATLNLMQKRYGFPGATAAYAWDDGRKGVAATGMADAEALMPMTTEWRMLAASIGKMFVGAVAASLIKDGVLAPDVPISTWLGERAWFSRLPNHGEITLRHLLTHRSGLPNHVYMGEFASEVKQRMIDHALPISPDSLVQFVLDHEPLFDAGRGWAYTDTGYILVGLIIQEATGQDIYSIIEEQFLTPLKLCSTNPSDRYVLPGLAAGYAAENSLGFPVKTTTPEGRMVWHPGIEWTGGGLISTSADLASWGAALFGGDALSEKAFSLLLDAQPIDPSTDEVLYGMGVAIYKSKAYGTVYGHRGWIPGYTSSLRYYKNYGVAIAFQINTDIGIMDDSSKVIESMEKQLLETTLTLDR
jgi:D-alanyl-D-alanine carboxypeptidase